MTISLCSARATDASRRSCTRRRLCLLLSLATCIGGVDASAHDLIFTNGFEEVTDAPASDAEAARFLTMATFGPTPASIAQLRGVGYSQWIEQQLSMPTTLQEPPVQQLDANVKNPGPNDRMQAWFDDSITATDQLRQRMAWALSQIMVVSDGLSMLGEDPIAVAGYYDVLARDSAGYFDSGNSYHAGSYYNLLYDVTKNPAMGKMLTYIRNVKPDPQENLSPDENYAREVMQLFSIGLTLRNPDFTQILSGGQPIPTYVQATVGAYAQVFTGWSYASGFNSNPEGLNWLAADYLPMICYDQFHDETDAKTLLSYTGDYGQTSNAYTLPAHNGCEPDLDQGLSILSNHPNVAPFISRQLIERIVSSNPSSCYIGNVSAVFTNTQGDLGAVIKAVLTDPEALTGTQDAPCNASDFVFGKAREPLLKLTALWRYYSAAAQNGLYSFPHPETSYAQRPLGAPSVFNFYLPDYLPPGELGQAGLYGPEFQILNESTTIATANDLTERANAYAGNPGNTNSTIAIDLSGLVALAPNPSALISQINHDLFYGGMSSATNAILVNMVTALPASNPVTRATAALQVALLSPEFAIQK